MIKKFIASEVYRIYEFLRQKPYSALDVAINQCFPDQKYTQGAVNKLEKDLYKMGQWSICAGCIKWALTIPMSFQSKAAMTKNSVIELHICEDCFCDPEIIEGLNR